MNKNAINIDAGDADKPKFGAKRVAYDNHEEVRTIAEFNPEGEPVKDVKDEKYKEVRKTFRELLLYIVFITLASILAFGSIEASMYYLTRSMVLAFADRNFESIAGETTFRESVTVEDFWAFMESAMPASLYGERGGYGDPADATAAPPLAGAVLGENVLLGRVRVRQLRVRDDTCVVHDDFRRNFATCYSFFSPSNEDTKTFGPGDEAWRHRSGAELGGAVHWGLAGGVYSGGGYAADLPRDDPSAARDRLGALKAQGWIDRGTRVVFVDFTTYNANVNLFCVVKLVFEFPPTGGVLPSSHFRSLRLLRYLTAWDYFLLTCEIAYILFVLFYTAEEIYDIWRHGCRTYYRQFWNYVDLVTLIISYLCIIFSIYRYAIVERELDTLYERRDEYINFEYLSFWQIQYNNAVAICAFFIWLKIFKYINFNKTMRQLSSTLKRCAKDISGFAVMFFIVFLAFAQLGYLLFGTQASGYRSFGAAVFTLLTTILGEFDYQEIEQANRVLGPIYFLSYIFFVFFVLLNMFLAIVNDTYSEVKREVTTDPGARDLGAFLRRGGARLLRAAGCRRLLSHRHKHGGEGAPPAEQSEEDKMASDIYEQIRKTLQLCNFTDLEIEMFFAKYDIDGDRRIDEREKQKIIDYLQGKEQKLPQVSDYGLGVDSKAFAKSKNDAKDDKLAEEYNSLRNRVSALEGGIEGMTQRVGYIVQKVESISTAVKSKTNVKN